MSCCGLSECGSGLQALLHPHRIAHELNDEIQFYLAFLEPIFQVFIAVVLEKRSTLTKGANSHADGVRVRRAWLSQK